MAVAAAAMCLLVWFLPAIAAHTPLRQLLLAHCVGELPIQVSAGEMSLGWLSPVVLNEIRVADTDGNELLSIDAVRTDQQLWRLLTHRADTGAIRLHRPLLWITYDADGGNLDRLLSDLLSPEPNESATAATLVITNGTIVVVDRAQDSQWRVENLDVSLSLPADDAQPFSLICAGQVAGGPEAGSFDVDLSRRAESGRPAVWKLQATGNRLPLKLIEPLLRRSPSFHDINLDGRMTSRLAAEWGDAQGGQRLEGQLQCDDLSLGGAVFSGDQPRLRSLVVAVNLQRNRAEWNVKQFDLQCDLGQLSCSGTLVSFNEEGAAGGWHQWADALTSGQYEVSGQIDLARLAAALPRTLRLREQTMIRAGQVELQVTNRNGEQGWAWDGRLDVSNLEGDVRGQPLVWQRPIHVVASIHGDTSGTRVDLIRCESEFLNIEGQGNLDSLRLSATYDLARLAEPLARFIDSDAVGLAGKGQTTIVCRRDEGVDLHADVDSQWRRLLVTLAGWEFAGDGRLEAAVALRESNIVVENATLTSTPLIVAGHGIDLREPELRLEGAGRWDTAAHELHVSRAVMTAGSLTARTQDARVSLQDGNRETNVTLVVSDDLERLSSRFLPPTSPRDWRIGGTSQTEIHLHRSAGELIADMNANVRDLVVQSGTAPRWQGRQMTITGRCRLDDAADTLHIEQLQCRGDGVTGQLSGQIVELGGRRQLNLRGAIQYDLARIEPLVQSQLGRGPWLAGRDTCRFQFNGPLSAISGDNIKQWSATADASWQSAGLFGARLGPATLNLRLQKGFLSIDPTRIAVNEGWLHLNPVVDLTNEPVTLKLPRGKLAERVRITPEMCAGALKYIAPVLAGVTQAEGRFSVTLDSCQVSLAAAENSDVSGRLTVHSAEIGPGPLVRELAILLDRPAPARLSRESNVAFHLIQGRVYHRDLELGFPDLTIRTHGSVGLDHTLAIMAEMPVPRKWVGSNSIGQALGARTIRLPIGGTLEQPRIDRRELDRVTAQFVRDTAVDALENELGRQLDKLFKPRN